MAQISGLGVIFAETLAPWITAFFALSLTTNVLAAGKRVLAVVFDTCSVDLCPKHASSSHLGTYHFVQLQHPEIPRGQLPWRGRRQLGRGGVGCPIGRSLYLRPHLVTGHLSRRLQCSIYLQGRPSAVDRTSVLRFSSTHTKSQIHRASFSP